MNYSDLSPLIMREIAETQGETFAYAGAMGYNTSLFARYYMKSEFCNKEMDSEYSYFHGKTDTVCFSCIEHEIGKNKLLKDAGIETLSAPYWVGAIYRYLTLFTGIPSKEIVDIISPEQLDDLSVSYDLYEMEEAAKDIVKTQLTF